MKTVIYKMLGAIRKFLWSLIVAYMLGIHNFYHGDNKAADDSAITIEVNEGQESGSPKD